MQWAIRRTVERRATRMHQMMDRLDVDALVIIGLRNGDAYTEARWRCLRCEESCLCLRWLDKGAADAEPDFCPNLEFFNACKMLASRSFAIAARKTAILLVACQSQGRQDLNLQGTPWKRQ